MSSSSEQDRERLKEEYKEHYRKIKDAKEKLRRSKPVQNISEAMQKMNSDELIGSMDDLLGKVRSKVAGFEARLETALDNLADPDTDEAFDSLERDEELRKERAKETLKQVRLEMGMLYSELEHRAGTIKVEKTVGPSRDGQPPQREKTVGTSGKVSENPSESSAGESGKNSDSTKKEQPPENKTDIQG